MDRIISRIFRTFMSGIECVNNTLERMDHWDIILSTLFVVFILHYMYNLLDGDFVTTFWRYVRKLPFIKNIVQRKLDETANVIQNQLQQGLEEKLYIQKIPENSWKYDDILDEIKTYMSYGQIDYRKGFVSGGVYPGNDVQLEKLVQETYGLTAYTNPLHPDVFPGIRIMEGEIINMVSSLFCAPKPVGTVTSGGTESIFLVCKAYRDYARFEKGITNPNMVIPVTAHAAFDKAAHMLKIKVRHVPFDPETTKVKIKQMRKLIDGDTIMLVGSSPSFPYGCIDPIEDIGKLGLQCKIPVHVDACLGGFLVPFMEEAGFPVPAFDFSVKGVTSVSVDTHKYAYAPKGTSIILYRDNIFRNYQYSIQPNWPGGIYGTPNLSGSRSGGLVATCWASLLFHGENKYIDSTRKIISTTKFIQSKLQTIKEIFIYGKPDVSVIAIGSNCFDVYRLSGTLAQRGWNLNLLQFPPGFHFCVTMQHTAKGVAEKFVSDVEECTIEIMKNPQIKSTGTAAIYGMAAQIPDRSLVSEIVWSYLNACYSAKNTTQMEKKKA